MVKIDAAPKRKSQGDNSFFSNTRIFLEFILNSSPPKYMLSFKRQRVQSVFYVLDFITYPYNYLLQILQRMAVQKNLQ